MPTFAAQDVVSLSAKNLIAMKKLLLSFGILMLALLPQFARSQENPEYTGTVPPPMPHEFLNVELARSMYHAQANGCYYGVTEAALSTRLIWPMQVEVRTVLSDGFLASKGAIRVWGVMAGPGFALRLNTPPAFQRKGFYGSKWAFFYPFFYLNFGGGYMNVMRNGANDGYPCLYLNMQTGWRLTRHVDLIVLSLTSFKDLRSLEGPFENLVPGIGLRYRFD